MTAVTYQLKPDYWSHYKRFQFIKKYIDLYKNPKILDMACGTGVLAAFPLAELGYDVTGVDIDDRSITAAAEENLFPNLKLVCSPFQTFHPGIQYDVVIAGYVMEHLQDPGELLTHINRLLEPGGTAIITIPNGYGPHEIETAIYHTLFEPIGYVEKMRAVNTAIGKWKDMAVHAFTGKVPIQPQNHTSLLQMTVNIECGHAVHLTMPWFRRLVEGAGFTIIEHQNSSFLHGQITGNLLPFYTCQSFITVNTSIADLLPSCMSSNWFFALKRTGWKRGGLCQ